MMPYPNTNTTRPLNPGPRMKTRETGQALADAGQNMEEAAKWTGRELEKSTADAIGCARAVGGKLVKGADWTADEVDKASKGQ
jgi:hypothetical protein